MSADQANTHATATFGEDPAGADDLAVARRVLAAESDGLKALSASLGEVFVRAVAIMAAAQGRIVVTGMGKSGHVGRKIAATLASTGTPAMFVHPAEASHGDLGMITSADVIFALSNSGETAELADLIAYAKRFAIPLVAVTGKAQSSLADNADAALIYPDSPEACPMGLAPTTSTTVMMGLGDAVAVALLERKGFSSDDFHALHPGGKLGRRLMKVADIMHKGDELPLVAPEMPMTEALLVMTAKRFGCLGVVDAAGRLMGVITDGDLRRHMADNVLARSAGDTMTAGGASIEPDRLASEALGIMNARAITNLFVVENDRPVGILHIHDCLRAGIA
ncbi:KpsF/GutQ family sugar-phosphate isomerase [Thalassospiraceae bacterium LMO-SO8]|nr:KpsF/GutQ family sugar-phosphate isomerase [Alphaproteobacteria bacterium LMO-S08]WND77403.1 KpsF/GutQ family sugar-phosphate isomerase [Thalassospiraceae bacterium LMO-SO8]